MARTKFPKAKRHDEVIYAARDGSGDFIKSPGTSLPFITRSGKVFYRRRIRASRRLSDQEIRDLVKHMEAHHAGSQSLSSNEGVQVRECPPDPEP